MVASKMGEKDEFPADYHDSHGGARAPHVMGPGGVGSTGSAGSIYRLGYG
jgi:hypothetical protein